MKLRVIVAITMVAIILLALHFWNREGFTSSRARAADIIKWVKSTKRPSFVDYREAIEGGDIVEYNDVMRLKRNDELNIDTLSAQL